VGVAIGGSSGIGVGAPDGLTAGLGVGIGVGLPGGVSGSSGGGVGAKDGDGDGSTRGVGVGIRVRSVMSTVLDTARTITAVAISTNNTMIANNFFDIWTSYPPTFRSTF